MKLEDLKIEVDAAIAKLATVAALNVEIATLTVAKNAAETAVTDLTAKVAAAVAQSDADQVVIDDLTAKLKAALPPAPAPVV